MFLCFQINSHQRADFCHATERLKPGAPGSGVSEHRHLKMEVVQPTLSFEARMLKVVGLRELCSPSAEQNDPRKGQRCYIDKSHKGSGVPSSGAEGAVQPSIKLQSCCPHSIFSVSQNLLRYLLRGFCVCCASVVQESPATVLCSVKLQKGLIDKELCLFKQSEKPLSHTGAYLSLFSSIFSVHCVFTLCSDSSNR